MPSPEEIAAAKKVLSLKASGTSSAEDVSKAKQDLENVKKIGAKKALSSPDPREVVNAADEAGEESQSVHVVDSLGYDEDDCEHFEVNVNGKTITILEEPDRTLHAMGGSVVKSLFDVHYDEIKNAIHSYLESRGAKSQDDADQYPTNPQVESAQIANFLKAISQKNYTEADKYLQGTVESKIKASISRAIQNTK